MHANYLSTSYIFIAILLGYRIKLQSSVEEVVRKARFDAVQEAPQNRYQGHSLALTGQDSISRKRIPPRMIVEWLAFP